MDVSVTTSGPLFEKPDLGLALNRAMQQGTDIVGRRLRANLSGGIVRRGPGRYGHLGDQIRTRVVWGPNVVTGSVFPVGKAAFRAAILESGAKMHGIIPRARRQRALRRSGRRPALAFSIGGRRLFAAHVLHPGVRAFHFAERTLDETWPDVRKLLRRAVVETVGAT